MSDWSSPEFAVDADEKLRTLALIDAFHRRHPGEVATLLDGAEEGELIEIVLDLLDFSESITKIVIDWQGQRWDEFIPALRARLTRYAAGEDLDP